MGLECDGERKRVEGKQVGHSYMMRMVGRKIGPRGESWRICESRMERRQGRRSEGDQSGGRSVRRVRTERFRTLLMSIPIRA